MPDPTTDRTVRPFAAVLQEIRGGHCHNELGEKLTGLVDAVVEHGKAGTLTLRIDVRPTSPGDAMVLITDTVAVKKPEAPAPSSMFFVDDDRNLTREDPRQLAWKMEAVPRAASAPPVPRTDPDAHDQEANDG